MSGNWTFTTPEVDALADGNYSFTATATDAAGNVSLVSSAYTITVDADPPDAPVITDFQDNSDNPDDNVTNDTTPGLRLARSSM